MFSGIKPPGAYPVTGVTSAHPTTAAAGAGDHAARQVKNFDQFQCETQMSPEEIRMRQTVGRISQQVQIRPTRHEIETLQQQVQDGTYQPDVREIAARMLMISGEDRT